MSTSPRDVVDAYCDAINAKDLDALLALFADDAVLQHPIGTFEGPAKLREFYGGIVMKADTKLTVGARAADGNVAIAEVTGVSPAAPDQPQHACDVFCLDDDGRVSRLSIYYRNSAGG